MERTVTVTWSYATVFPPASDVFAAQVYVSEGAVYMFPQVAYGVGNTLRYIGSK